MPTALNVGGGSAGTYIVSASPCTLHKIMVFSRQGGNPLEVYDAASSGAVGASTLLGVFSADGSSGLGQTAAGVQTYELEWPMQNGIAVLLATSGSYSPLQISVEYG